MMSLEHDIWTIAASAGAAIASACVAIVILWTQRKQLKHQVDVAEHQRDLAKHQRDLNSARLVMDLDKEYRTEGFRVIHDLMADHAIKLDNDEHRTWFIRYINYSQFVCKLFADGLISKSDMHVSYGGLEPLLNMNESTREYIEKRELLYPYLHWYFRYSRALYRQGQQT